MTAEALVRPREVARDVALFPARTPTLPPATHTNSYALGGRDVVLVEPATPYDDERAEWLAWANGLRSQGRHLRAIFATHHHADHVGGASFFAEALSLPLWAHRGTAARISAKVDRTFDDGDVIELDGPAPQRWDVLFTPGHAPGHLCLHERSLGVVVVGDMVASQGTILIAPGDGDMSAYLAQLGRLGDLNATRALPAHGEPIDDPSLLFAKYVAHRLAREALVLRALVSKRDTPVTAEALVPEAYADTPQALWSLAAMSLEMHLRKLVDDGKAHALGDGTYVAVEAS